MKVNSSRCLRTDPDPEHILDWMGESDRILEINQAKEECSKNWRCVGIEPYYLKELPFPRFKLCLDSIYTSTTWDKYKNLKNHVLKKSEMHGKYKYALPRNMELDYRKIR